MAKARRKLRRQLIKKARKGYLTPGEREDLIQLDREVNKANRQAAAVGVPSLAAALAMASRSGALSGMGDSLSGLVDNMKERRKKKEEEKPIETTDTNQEVSLDEELKKLQEENSKKFTTPDFVPTKRDEEEEDYFEEEARQIRREVDRANKMLEDDDTMMQMEDFTKGRLMMGGNIPFPAKLKNRMRSKYTRR